ncbi:short-chain dehydrogenase reductase SDR [Fusarium albosuccineum]|uniref:Short-chain dehydrogenase reductase SDR n=1 Tax=Fusarium albosuccineum TaxID=1237068 RepID=A0A8H4LP60_9HYPO|nr:short-chain dehydrogenase reductase SDR [Fusarium albosuccineum]
MTKSVFITGANSGVGLASTKLFLSEGWNVAATARDTSCPSLRALDDGSGSLFVQYLDLSKPETFQPAVAGAIGKFGKIDVLVNNAGYAQYGVLEQLDVDAIRRNFEVNVFGMALPGLRRRVSTTLTAEQTGTMGLIKEFIPHLRATSRAESPSRIIYVGSGGGHFGLPLIGPYGASKAAMNIFMESLVYEMEGVEPPIQVKLVCPHGGITETNFGQTSMQFAGLDKMTTEVRQRYGPFIERTLQRFGAMRGQSMAAPEAAKTVWTAATEDSTQLRYFVGPRDGGENLRRRMMLDGQADADEADKRYMDEMRATFL